MELCALRSAFLMQIEEGSGAPVVLTIPTTPQQGSDGERNNREREKNRKAQARFRERQKLKSGEVERRMGELQAAVQKLQLERDALGSKADMLERALLHEDRVHSASLGPVTGGLQLQAKFERLVKFYKNGVQELAPLLIQCQLQPDSEAPQTTARKWQQLVAEALIMYDDESLRTMAYNRPLVGEGEVPPAQMDKLAWRRMTRGLHLTEQQRERCREVRKSYLSTMCTIMTERLQLNGGMWDTTPPDLSSNCQVAQHAAGASESMKALRVNLRSEQMLQTELSYELFMRVLTPIQAATVTVGTVPWLPDKLAILEAVTESEGDAAA